MTQTHFMQKLTQIKDKNINLLGEEQIGLYKGE